MQVDAMKLFPRTDRDARIAAHQLNLVYCTPSNITEDQKVIVDAHGLTYEGAWDLPKYHF